jgi:hypothetical protein
MTRDREIEYYAHEYAEKHGVKVSYDGNRKYYDVADIDCSYEGFVNGAKWADEHKEDVK